MDIHARKQEITESLDLAESARKDAASGIPAGDAAAPSGTETNATAEAEKAGREEIETLENFINQTEDAVEPCQNALDAARRHRQTADAGEPPKDNLDVKRRARDGAIAAYNKFKDDNGLTRDASGDDRFIQISWAVLIALIEGGANAMLLRDVFSGGIIDALTTAFFISFTNVAFAFIGGALCLRYAVNHCNSGVKLGGLCGFLACLAVCAAVVATVSWFRGHAELLLSKDLGWYSAKIRTEAWKNTMESFRAADIWSLFSSLEGFLLVAAGAFCAIVGVWKGYEFDDSYPGFGARFRDKENAEEAFREAQTEHDGRLQQWRQNSRGGVKNADKELADAVAALRARMHGMNKRRADAVNLSAQVAQLANGLLAVYRQHNSAIRAGPPPPYFSQFPPPEEFAVLDTLGGQTRLRAEKMRETAESLLQECEQERRECKKMLQKHP